MENYNITGIITTISPIAEVGTGKKLSFRIDTGEQYNNIVEFEMYKGADYIEHLDKFVQYNKVGDNVNVEFNIKTYNWKPEADNKIFTSLSCWRVEKIGGTETEPQVEESEPTKDDLPF